MKTPFALLNWIVFVAACGASVASAKAPIQQLPAKVVTKTQVQATNTAKTSAPTTASARGPASLSAGISDSQKSLEIRGQSRNLSMLLVLKNRHENIDFVKPRETYRTEIQNTQY